MDQRYTCVPLSMDASQYFRYISFYDLQIQHTMTALQVILLWGAISLAAGLIIANIAAVGGEL